MPGLRARELARDAVAAAVPWQVGAFGLNSASFESLLGTDQEFQELNDEVVTAALVLGAVRAGQRCYVANRTWFLSNDHAQYFHNHNAWSSDVLVFPTHLSRHWALITVAMRTNPREIRCTDSLCGSLTKEAEQIRDRLTSLWGEHCSGRSPEYTIVDASDSSPVQSKNLACGLYTIMNGLQ